MNGEAIISVSAAVVALTQLLKWAGLDDSKGPLAVLVASLLGVAFWGWSTGDITRASAFGYFAGWIAVMTSSAGVYGFTRSTGDSLTKMRSGPVVLLALALGALTLNGCASLPAKQKVSQAHQVAHQALVTIDEAERALCQPVPAATNTCGNPAAAALGLTNAKHQDFSRKLAKAFDDDVKAGVAIVAWRAGDPVPADLATLFQDAQDLAAVANTITDNPLATKVQTFIVRLRDVLDAFGGGK